MYLRLKLLHTVSAVSPTRCPVSIRLAEEVSTETVHSKAGDSATHLPYPAPKKKPLETMTTAAANAELYEARVGVKRTSSESTFSDTVPLQFQAPHNVLVEDEELDVIALDTFSASEQSVLLGQVTDNFDDEWEKEQREWVQDTDLEISCRKSVCTVTTVNGKRVVLDTQDGNKLFCQMVHNCHTGKKESVAVFINGKLRQQMKLKTSEQPQSKKTKFEKIKTGKGGWAVFEIDAACAM